MVSSLFISSVLALSAVVSASTPLVARSVANVEAGKHIGVGDVGIAGVLNNALQVKNIGVHDNLDSARVLSGGHNIHEYEHGGSDYGSGDFDGIRDYDLGENDYGHNPFESSDGDIDGDFDDYFGDGGDNGDNGDNGGCGGGCDGGCGRRHPRIPHRVGRVGGGCR